MPCRQEVALPSIRSDVAVESKTEKAQSFRAQLNSGPIFRARESTHLVSFNTARRTETLQNLRHKLQLDLVILCFFLEMLP